MKKLNSMNSEMETSLDRGMRKKSANNAFTLAEMMVVMLILSIVMAAFAPVVTTRSKTDFSSPWRRASNNSDIYYGLGDNQTAMIGQPNKSIDLDPSNRLTISTSTDEQNHIIFKRGENRLDGVLRVNGGGILLGTLQSGGLDTGNIGIGPRVALGGQDNIAIGQSASAQNDYSISIGQGSNANAGESIAIGNNAKSEGNQGITVGAESKANGTFSSAYGYHAEATGKYSTAIGEYAKASAEQSLALHSTASGKSSTAIGYGSATNEFSLLLAPGNSTGSGVNKSESIGISSIAIGSNTHAKGGYALALGTGSTSTGDSSVAVGTTSSASDDYAISIGRATSSSVATVAIGDGANATSDYAIALGVNTKAKNAQSVAIGYYSTSDGANATAIGTSSTAKGENGIAIGNNSKAAGENNIAIGQNACQYASGSNKICIGNNSGPKSGDSWATDGTQRVFIGGQSNFNGGAAVLEVHNTGGNIEKNTKDTAVVINGNLVVKGYILQPIAHSDHKNDRDLGDGNYSLSWQHHNRGTYRSDNKGKSDLGHSDNLKVDPLSNEYTSGSRGGISDRRLKYVGTENSSGLDKIKLLKVFNYTYKNDDTKTPRVGVIAQDLQKVFPNAVKKGDDGYLTIRWDDMFYAVINAIKELDAKVTSLTEQLKIVQEQNKQILKQNKEIIKQNKDLEARLKAVEASKK